MGSLWEGFGSHPITSSSQQNPGTMVAGARAILQTALFETWDDFDQAVCRAVFLVPRVLDQQGCKKRSQESSRCDGSFRDVNCTKPICSKVRNYKSSSNTFEYQSLQALQDSVSEYLLQGVALLAHRINAGWRGEINTDLNIYVPYKNSTRKFRPSSCVTQPGKANPDVALCVRKPNQANLLVNQDQHTTLASAYRTACASVGHSGGLAYDLNGIAQTIAYALCTRTGMACLYNHDEAVFVKVSVRVVHRGSSSSSSGASSSSRASQASSRSGEKLHVQVSRSYNCNTYPTSFHGLLTMVLLAFNDSSSATADRNMRHLASLIHISEQKKR